MFVVVNVVVPATLKVELNVVAAVVTANVVSATKAASVDAPSITAVPSTIKLSLMLIVVESSELKVVPSIFIAPKTTFPVPDGENLILSFDLTEYMLLPEILIPAMLSPPVPFGTILILSVK